MRKGQTRDGSTSSKLTSNSAWILNLRPQQLGPLQVWRSPLSGHRRSTEDSPQF